MSQNTKNPLKIKWLKILSALFALILVAGIALLLNKRPDYLYLISEYVSGFTAAPVQLAETDADAIPMKTYTAEELEADERITVNQSMLLINSDYPLEDSFAAQTTAYQEGEGALIMNSCITEAYQQLAAAVKEQYGETLYVKSAYRTAAEQTDELAAHGETAAAIGCSEHQAGLALDVYVPYYAGRAFLKTEAGQYVNSHCWEYGFIIRYPYYGEAQTGIPYEPWHIRYVGAPHAEIIYKGNMTLESYYEALEIGCFYEYGDYWITRQNGGSFTLPEEFETGVVSPDHQGNTVITLRRSDASPDA